MAGDGEKIVRKKLAELHATLERGSVLAERVLKRGQNFCVLRCRTKLVARTAGL